MDKTTPHASTAHNPDIFERLTADGNELLSGHTRGDVLDRILRGMQARGFDRVRLFLLSDDGQTLVGVAQVGIDEMRFANARWPVAADSHFQRLLQQPKPQIFRLRPGERDEFEQYLDKADVPEWAAVPLVWRGKVVGQITADNKYSQRPIHVKELPPLALFAVQAAAALEKADFAEQAERKTEQLQHLERLAHATAEIVGQLGKLPLPDLLTLIARHAAEMLMAEVCSVLLVKRPGVLSLAASYGHREGSFQPGLEFLIERGTKTGITGYIAAEERLVNLRGKEIHEHPAVRAHENTFTPSGKCDSLLACPLKRSSGGQEKLLGLLRVHNKRGADGQPHSTLAFSREDEWIINIFAEAVVVCLETAELMAQAGAQRQAKDQLIGNLPQALIAIDRQGNVTEFNRQAELILGYTRDEVLGKKVSLLYHDPEMPKLIAELLDESSEGRITGYETQIRTKNGQAVPIRLSAYWLHDKGRCIGSVGIFEDLRSLNAYKDRLALMLRAINIVTEAKDLREGLQRLAEMLVSLFPGIFCRIVLADEGDATMTPGATAFSPAHADKRNPPADSERSFPVSDFPRLADTLAKGRPRTLRYSNPESRANLERLSAKLGFQQIIQTLLVIPLKLGERVVGFFDLGELCAEAQSLFMPGGAEQKENYELAKAIAEQSALLIGRMLTLQFAEKARERLLAFYDVSSQWMAEKDPDLLLKRVVEEMREAAGALNVDLVLIDEQGQAETPVAVSNEQISRRIDVRPEGVSMQVFKNGIAARFPDTSQAREQLNPELLRFAGAAICLPLSLPYKRIGVMWLHYKLPHHFTEQEVAALQLYANQAAVAYENAQGMAYRERLTAAAEALALETEVGKVRDQILLHARETLRTEMVIFGYFDDKLDTFIQEFSEARGIAPEVWEQYRGLNTGQQTTAYQLLSKGLTCIDNLATPEAKQALGENTFKAMTQCGVRSFQALPLCVGHEKLGIVVALYRQPRGFNRRERLTAEAFARYAALALKRAKLIEQVNKAHDAAKAVTQITVLGDRRATLQALVEEVKKVIGCDAVVLYEYDPDKQRLMPPTTTGVRYPEQVFRAEEGHRLVYQILHEQRRWIVEQVALDRDLRERCFAKTELIESFVAYPLRANNKTVGVIFINYRVPRHFTAEELDAIELFANQAALAIHYAQSTEADARKLRELKALEELSELFRQEQSLQSKLEYVVSFVAREFKVDCCNLVLLDQTGALHLRAQSGWNPPLTGSQLPPGDQSQTGLTIRTRHPVIVADYTTERRFQVAPHLLERGMKAGVSAPLFRENEIVGALLVFSSQYRWFSEEEVGFLELIANHMAVALHSAERFDFLQRKDRHLKAVYDASKAMLASFGREQAVLNRILHEAVESISRTHEPKARLVSSLLLYDTAHDELVIGAIYPAEGHPHLQQHIGAHWLLDRAKAPDGRIGVIGRAIELGRSLVVGEVAKDPDYIRWNDWSKAELCVLLWWNGQPMGAINVESDQLNGFDPDDQLALESLAEIAVIAIQTARLYEDLKKTKNVVGARTALAWMGMANNAWRHINVGDAAEIGNRVTLIREFLNPALLNDERIRHHLGQIERLAKNIQDKPPTLPLSSEEGVALVNLNDLIAERLGQLRQNERYAGVRLEAQAHTPQPATVRLSSEWLRRALDILVDNATRAVRSLKPPDSARQVVTVTTAVKDGVVEIVVADRGSGMSDAVLEKLFVGKIESHDGSGVGLLIAQAVVETYGGAIGVQKSDAQGTEMLIRLPYHQ